MITIISEDHYEQIMKQTVEPLFASQGMEDDLPTSSGRFIHYCMLRNPEAKANVVISHGFTESGEKYMEMAYYFYQAGYSVFLLDHHGHGRSHRKVADPSITYVEHFHDYIEDLHIYMEKIVLPNAASLPIDLYAHSMGGAIAAFYLMEYPEAFRRCVLTSPMIQPLTAPFPMWLARAIAGFLVLIGKTKDRSFTNGPYDPDETFEDSPDTSRARFAYYRDKRRAHSYLQNSSPAYGWVRESLLVNRSLLNKKKLSSIKTPILLMQAEHDTFVRVDAESLFVSRTPNAKLRFFPGTKHEIYMSDDATMQEYVSEILSFLTGSAVPVALP